MTKSELANQLFELANLAQSKGWNAEELLRNETSKRERKLRQLENRSTGS
jgi:hypothetical protein